MDLLGTYSSDEDDSDSERSRTPPSPIKKTVMYPGTVNNTSPKKPLATKGKATGSTTTTTKTAASAKRGKKLMSLHSVLPPHILEQLTKSEATGSYEDSDSDDEDDGSNRDKNKNKKESGSSNKNKPPAKNAEGSQDAGIASFLNALHSVQATTGNSNKQLKKPPSGGASAASSTNISNNGSSSKLGSAFVSAVTTTTIRKKDGTTTSTTTTNESSSSNPKEPREVDHPSTPTGDSVPSPNSPSHYKPLSLSPRTAFQPFRNTSAIAAAPPVPNNNNNTSVPAPSRNVLKAAPPIPQQLHHHHAAAYPPPPPPQVASAASYPYHQQYQQQQEYVEDESPQISHGNKRSQKRQLQKALRAGQFDQTGNVVTDHLDQAQPSAFVPQEETYALPAHGVKVASTQMYNPSAGTNVQADLTRVKGKNQINHLMASAAQLELQQARTGGKPGSNSQRAGAKRKYGW